MKLTVATINNVFKAKKATVETMEMRGYSLVREFFVDNSGLGSEGELALTRGQFEAELGQLLKERGQLTAKITREGQFQVYVGLFEKSGKSKAQRLENNTYKVIEDYGYSIRLHDTIICKISGTTAELNSGGWLTRTTMDRMNKHIGNNRIVQRKYKWYVQTGDGRTLDYKDGIIIQL